jgi:hypothetical protein
MSQANNIDPDKLRLSQTSGDAPSASWLVVTNAGAGQTWIVVPQAGNLWVFYEYSTTTPAAAIEVWHQGGKTTPINPGANIIPVGALDAIMYRLNDPDTDMIKVAFQYT